MLRIIAGFAVLGAWVGCSTPSLLVGQDPAGTDGGSDGVVGLGGSDALGGETEAPDGNPRVSRTVSLYVNQVRAARNDQGELIADNAFKCLPFALDPTQEEAVQVRAIEVRPAGECACDSPVSAKERSAAESYLAELGYCQPSHPENACSQFCMCEIGTATDETRDACLSGGAVPAGSRGYCYVSEDPAIGNPELLADCSPSEKHGLSFFGLPSDGLVVVLAARVTETLTVAPERHLALGSPCLPEAESDPKANGFGLTEAAVNTESPSCDSGVCVVNHFQGRVSCPFGQGEVDNVPGQVCFVPYSDELVTVPVHAQRIHRAAKDVATCSCRCAGPGDGPFCTCPTTMTCSPLIEETGILSSDALKGSYCVRRGTEYDPQSAGTIPATTCAETELASEITACGDPRPY